MGSPLKLQYSFILAFFFASVCYADVDAKTAVRLKDLVTIKGVRENILIGYGIVVGLKGTGDSNTDITGQSLARLFTKLGLDIQNNVNVKSKNAAAVIATAKLPPFARVGGLVDVTVSSIGDSSSLEGGMLLVTPLRAGDQNVYAVAQGPVSLGSMIDGTTKNFPTIGRVISGGTIEKDLDINFFKKKSFRLALNHADFTTAARVVLMINNELGGHFATAQDSGTIDVLIPFNYDGNLVDLIALLENIKIHVDSKAKVVLNERTGTVVIGHEVSISPVSLSHGDLSLEIKADTGHKTGTQSHVFEMPTCSTVSELVKVLNLLGVKPKDLTAIFQALKDSGALQAVLEIL